MLFPFTQVSTNASSLVWAFLRLASALLAASLCDCQLCSDEILVIAPLRTIPILGDFKAKTGTNGIFVVSKCFC